LLGFQLILGRVRVHAPSLICICGLLAFFVIRRAELGLGALNGLLEESGRFSGSFSGLLLQLAATLRVHSRRTFSRQITGEQGLLLHCLQFF
jgi:hypothetical protein